MYFVSFSCSGANQSLFRPYSFCHLTTDSLCSHWDYSLSLSLPPPPLLPPSNSPSLPDVDVLPASRITDIVGASSLSDEEIQRLIELLLEKSNANAEWEGVSEYSSQCRPSLLVGVVTQLRGAEWHY